MRFKQPIIRSEQHLRFIASLPCLVTGAEDGIQAHHLMRTGRRGVGMKSADDMTIPLHYEIHDRLHRHGNETKFLAHYGIIDPINTAGMLYEYTMDDWQARRFIRESFEENWKKYDAANKLLTRLGYNANL